MNKPAPIDPRILKELKPGRRRGWFRWWMAAIVLLVLGGVAWAMMAGGPGGPRFELAKIERHTIVVKVTATGKLEPEEKVDVGAEVSGQIEEVLVDFNAPVTKGQVIARLDTDALASRVISAKANLTSAEASVKQAMATEKEARQRRDRLKELRARGNASQQELDNGEAAWSRAQAGVDTARAQVELAKAQLTTAETDLAKAEIVSPIDGLVLDRKIEVGQTVAASFQTPVLFTLASDLTRMELHVDVDEADIGQVRAGHKATFQVDAFPARRFEAAIIEVRNAPREVNNVVTYEAILSVSNPDGLLKPGMTATAEITVETVSEALAVANGALRFTPPDEKPERIEPGTDGKRQGRVWVLEGGKPQGRLIEIGATDGERTQVVSGELAEGDEVVLDLARDGGAQSGR